MNMNLRKGALVALLFQGGLAQQAKTSSGFDKGVFSLRGLDSHTHVHGRQGDDNTRSRGLEQDDVACPTGGSFPSGATIVDDTGAGDYTTIQKAIDNAMEGDTIVVYPSTGSRDGGSF